MSDKEFEEETVTHSGLRHTVVPICVSVGYIGTQSQNSFRQLIHIYIHSLNIRLKTFSAGGCRQWCFAWFLVEFRVFQHHTPLTKQTLSEMISLWYALQFTEHWNEKENLDWLFTYLDDHRPLIRQTTSQIRGSVYFSDLRVLRSALWSNKRQHGICI